MRLGETESDREREIEQKREGERKERGQKRKGQRAHLRIYSPEPHYYCKNLLQSHEMTHL